MKDHFQPHDPLKLGQILEQRHKEGADFYSSSPVNRGFRRKKTAIFVTGLPVQPHRMRLGNTEWIAPKDTYLAELHLDTTPLRKRTIKNAATGLHEVLDSLAEIGEWIQHKDVPFVIAASNQFLIRTLMRVIPSFRVVDYINPQGYLAESITDAASDRRQSFGREVSKGIFPVVAVPKRDFIKRVSTFRRLGKK